MDRKNSDTNDIRQNDKEKRKNRKRTGGRMRNLGEALYMELREHRSSFIVYFTLRILVIVMLVLQLLNRNYENVFFWFLFLRLRFWGKSVSSTWSFLFGIRCCIRSTVSLRQRSVFLW